MNQSCLTNKQLERRIERIESRLSNPDDAFHTIEWLKPLRDEDREVLARFKHEHKFRRHVSDYVSQSC